MPNIVRILMWASNSDKGIVDHIYLDDDIPELSGKYEISDSKVKENLYVSSEK